MNSVGESVAGDGERSCGGTSRVVYSMLHHQYTSYLATVKASGLGDPQLEKLVK